MADGSGQKGIKNSLLSGATTASFFEEAAMLIPVPLADPTEPATAEIDLNSDDSSSNRGSVEKEMSDQPILFAEIQSEPVVALTEDDKATPISLFSRASTGVDAFTRMLAGTSSTKSETKSSEILLPPASSSVASLSSEPMTNPQLLPPLPSNLFPSPSTAPTSIVNSGLVLTDFSSSAPFATSIDQGKVNFAPASSLFPAGSGSSSMFSSPNGNPLCPPTPMNNHNMTLPSSTLNTATTNSVFNPSAAVLASTNSPGTMNTVQLTSATTPVYSTPFGNNVTAQQQPVTAFQPPSSRSPLLPTVPTATTPVGMSSVPPPSVSGGGNSFRLGSQRMKYVPCPEMQSSPAVAPMHPLPFDTQQNMMTSLVSPSSAPPSTFSRTSMANSQAVNSPSLTSLQQQISGSNDFNGSFTQGSQLGHGTIFQQTNLLSEPQDLPLLSYHWFFKKETDGKVIWKAFSILDSMALEDALVNDSEKLVPTDGGRYDVCVKSRLKMPVYWEETVVEVRRASWFYKGPMDNRYIPYDEDFAMKLEHEYANCMKTGIWQKRLEFPGGESVIMHNSGVVVHFCQAAAPDDWGNLPESQIRPRVVKRGVEEIEVEDGEASQIDQLVFVVHGIGPICDFKLRNIVEAVDDFRGLSFQLITSHFKESIDKNLVGRVEFLPVSWHKALHRDKGIDEQLRRITLRSIPKFRDFTNDTLLDILFYTSPVYCQTIVNSVGSELNRLYKLFLSRNPTYKGNVSLVGHSLGSLILFDLLAHQQVDNDQTNNKEDDSGKEDEIGSSSVSAAENTGVQMSSSLQISYTVSGTAGTGQPNIKYPKLDFPITAFFALGSPIAMFVTVRGIEKLGNDFRFPTCPAFFNIFHPYDPVAYRIETLIDPEFQPRAVLIPHHKGRKRIHLELKETISRVGADLKQKMMDTVKITLNTVYHYTGFNKAQENLEHDIDSAIATEIQNKSEADGPEAENAHLKIGSLNGGRRIDHVLQEAPYETFNEYVFAMACHVGYWESEDSMLLILNEIYDTMGIKKDNLSVAASITTPTVPSHVGLTQQAASIPYKSPIGNNKYPSPFQPIATSPYAPGDYSSITSATRNLFIDPVGASTSMSPNQPPIPMIPPTETPLATGPLLPPNPVIGGLSSSSPSGSVRIVGNRPVADPSTYPRGMDPTAPISMSLNTQVGPPPKVGFVPKQN